MQNQNTRKRRVCIAISFVAAAALLGGFVAHQFLALKDQVASSKNNTSALSAQSPANLALNKVKNFIDNSNKSTGKLISLGDHEVPSALNFSSADDYRQSAHWFDNAERSSDGKFVATHTPLVFDASCKTYKESKHTSFEAAIVREVEFDPTQSTPIDMQVQELAQFWRIGETFYKLTGRWERDQPATYRVNLFSASNANFENDLRVLPLPEGLVVQTDVITLSDAMDREVDRAIAINGARGARLTQVFYPSASGTQALEVSLHNGRPVSWMFGHGRCQLREAGDAYCRCIPPDSAEKNHSHDQQPVGQPQKHTKENQYRVHD
jgi:hypothetical protein